MAYHRKSIENRPIESPAWHRLRRGSFIVEAVVAMALFSTAVIALGRLSQSTASLSVKADQRLSAQLTGENVLARLHVTPLDQIDSAIKDIQSTTKVPTTFDVQIETEDFKAGDQEGVHLVVQVTPAKQVTSDQSADQSAIAVPNHVPQPLVTLHDWRLAESNNEPRPDEKLDSNKKAVEADDENE